jgi:hypothetical protein
MCGEHEILLNELGFLHRGLGIFEGYGCAVCESRLPLERGEFGAHLGGTCGFHGRSGAADEQCRGRGHDNRHGEP